MKARRGVQRIESQDAEPILGTELPSLEDDSLSLEQLGKVYAEMLAGTSSGSENTREGQNTTEPSVANPNPSVFNSLQSIDSQHQTKTDDLETADEVHASLSQDELAITPERIVEALLFVGQPENKPLTGNQLASTMRGVHEDEIPGFVQRLNQLYESTGRVMRIEQHEGGFVLRVAPAMQRSTNAIQGKLRETRLPPSAVDCLALVAYNPGATREEIEKLWNRSASSMLSLLVRKELLEIVREEENSSKANSRNAKLSVARYHPTERFLNLLGLTSLHDLPRVDSDL